MAYLLPVVGRREKISRKPVNLSLLTEEECHQLTRNLKRVDTVSKCVPSSGQSAIVVDNAQNLANL